MSQENLDKEILSDALKLFQRSEKAFEADLKVLKEWVLQQPHFPEVMDDIKIENFLLLSKANIEKAKRRIDCYYTFRSATPEFFLNPKLPIVKRVDDFVCIASSLNLNKSKYKVFFGQILDMNVIEEIGGSVVAAKVFNLMEMLINEKYVVGNILVVDIKNVSITGAIKHLSMVLSAVLPIYEKTYSIPVKALYFINSGSVFEICFKLFKKLFKQKVLERIHDCVDASILHGALEEDEIPIDYGGTGKSFAELQEILNLKLLQYQDRFDKLDGLSVNEKLRPKLENDEILGFYGSFKRIEID